MTIHLISGRICSNAKNTTIWVDYSILWWCTRKNKIKMLQSNQFQKHFSNNDIKVCLERGLRFVVNINISFVFIFIYMAKNILVTLKWYCTHYNWSNLGIVDLIQKYCFIYFTKDIYVQSQSVGNGIDFWKQILVFLNFHIFVKLKQ